MANIKQMKTVHYKVESAFGEAYDPTASFQEIAVSELEITRAPEDLSTLYLNKSRVLDEDHASGRTNGGFTCKKNIDTSLMANHEDLIGTALGTVVDETAVPSPVTDVTNASGILTFAMTDTSIFSVGQTVQFVSTAGVKYAFNRIASIVADTSITFEYQVCNDEVDRIVGKAGNIHGIKYIRPSVPDMAKTYQFVVTFQDDSVEVFRGASAKASFSITKEGKGEIDFEIQSAEVQSINMDTKVALSTITGTMTEETQGNPIIFNFQTSTIFDFKNGALAMDFPYALNIEFGNTIEPIKKTGCLNNIGGWYIKPSIKGTCSWERTPDNLVNYSKAYEGDNRGILFTSNADFAFFAQKVKFTNADAKAVDSYDSIDTTINVNSWVGESSEPILVLPQTYS